MATIVSIHAKRKDLNTNDIEQAVVEAGWGYIDVHDYGKGFPDCVVYKTFKGLPVCVLIEIKSATGRLTTAEKRFQEQTNNLGYICRTADDVKDLLAKYDKKFEEKRRAK